MIQVWKFDSDKVFTESAFIDEQSDFQEVAMTLVPLLVGYIKPKFDGANWVEGATPQEIIDWESANTTAPQPTETEVLKRQINEQQDTIDFLLRLQGLTMRGDV